MLDDYSNRQIGDFIVEEQLGRGAMSVVYRAVQQSFNRRVALKIINLNLNPLARENYQPYFIQEAKVIATLEHIHIVPIYNYGAVDEESSYIAMRLLQRGSVLTLLEDGIVDLYRAVDIFSQAARGLAHAHGRGIIHRDLKPSNILLDDLGNAYLTDFGLGKLAEVSLDLTEAGNVIGTPLYASPEQLTGDPIDHRTDIYSMSAILYHMLTGRPPYSLGEGGLGELIRAQATTRPDPVCQLNPLVPAEIDEVILQGLSHNPDDRPSSIEEMAETINRALGRRSSPNSDPLIYVREVTQQALQSRGSQQLRLIATMIGIVVVAAIMIALSGGARGRPQPSVRAGARGDAQDVAPAPAEIEAARAALGSDGFIAFVACGTSAAFHETQVEAMARQAAEYGVDLRVYDSQMDVYRQTTELERARVEGARAIILCALDSNALASSLEAAQAAGIPLVHMNPVQPLYGGVVLDGDHLALGNRAGTLAGNLIQSEFGGEGRVLLLEYGSQELIRERARGVEKGLSEAAPASYIVSRLAVNSAEEARREVASLIEQGTSFNVLISVRDGVVYDAIEALEAAGISPEEVVVISIDGEERARQWVDEGRYLRATIEVDGEASGIMAVDTAVRLLAGGSVPEYVGFPGGDVYTAGSPVQEATAANAP
ncbi:MAG: substrate-binding domain-containing protein [Chloroflexota bacterium]|nr:MAG: hypothetical protein DIU68_12715 [Chloroflexota bacterium]